LTLTVLMACRTTPQTIVPREVAAISHASGAVSASLIADPNSPLVQLGPGEEFVPPVLRPENRPPVYPANLIPLDLPPHTVAMRVTFDETGRVIDVASSPIAASTDDPYRPALEAAVKDAMSSWRCQPPQIRKFRQGPGFRILEKQRSFKTFFDVAFTFAVENGHPVVRAGAPKTLP
jgi:hypothetical protein